MLIIVIDRSSRLQWATLFRCILVIPWLTYQDGSSSLGPLVLLTTTLQPSSPRLMQKCFPASYTYKTFYTIIRSAVV